MYSIRIGPTSWMLLLNETSVFLKPLIGGGEMYKNSIRICLISLYVIVTMGVGKSFAEHAPGHIGGIQAPNDDFVLQNRDLVIKDSTSKVRIRLDAQSGDIRVLDPDGKTVALIEQAGRNMWLGSGGAGGDIVLLPKGKTGQTLDNASVHIDGDGGNLILGGAETDGQLVLRTKAGKQVISLDGKTADLILGQEGQDGDVLVRNATGNPTITLDGASGQVDAGQIISNHSASGSSGGIDTAAVYVESKNPAVSLLDTSGGNSRGWMIQAGSTGSLVFNPGNLTGLNDRVFVLQPDGGVCIGACR